MEKRSFGIPWLSVSLLLMGMYLSFCQEFLFPFSFLEGVVFSCLLSGIAVFVMLQEKRKNCMTGGLLIVGIAVFVLLARLDVAKDNLGNLFFYLDQQMQRYNGTSISVRGIDVAYTGGSRLLLLEIGLFSAFYIAGLSFRMMSRVWGLIVPYSVVALGLSIGTAPGEWGLLLLIAGSVLQQVFVTYQESGQKRWHVFLRKSPKDVWRAAVFACFFLAAGTVCGYFVCRNVQDDILQHHEESLAVQLRWETDLKKGAEQAVQKIRAILGIDSDGLLSNTEPVYEDKTVMRITFSKMPEDDVYLRGYVGSYYEDGKWHESDADEIEKIGEKAELRDVDEVIQGINDLDWKYCQYAEDSHRHIADWKIEYIGSGRRSKYAYVPYYSDLSKSDGTESEGKAVFDGDNGIRRRGNVLEGEAYLLTDHEMQRMYYGETENPLNAPGMIMSAGADADTEDILLGGVFPDSQDADWREAYLRYARKEYESLPENGLDRLKNYVSWYDDGERPYDQALGIQQKLRSDMEYSTNLTPVPQGVDYVEYFLFQQKKGFCEHFATAGTLLLRRRGNAARYVSGYRVPAEAFKKSKEGYTASVLDSYAHAWTDVLMGQMGWAPVDMTPVTEEGTGGNAGAPDFYDPNTQDDTDSFQPKNDIVQDTPQAPEDEREQTDPPEATEETGDEKGADGLEEDGIEGGERTENEEKEKAASAPPGVYAVMALLVCVTVGIACFRHKRVSYRRRAEKAAGRPGTERNRFICLYTEALQMFMRDSGVRRLKGHTDDEWLAEICSRIEERELVEGPLGKDWKSRFLKVMEKAYFSDRAADSEEMEDYRHYCHLLADGLFQASGRIKKGYLKFVGWNWLIQKPAGNIEGPPDWKTD